MNFDVNICTVSAKYSAFPAVVCWGSLTLSLSNARALARFFFANGVSKNVLHCIQ